MSQVLFLGTGSSLGIPVIGCHCSVCQSTSPFNKRLRSSILLTESNQTILIDASPDLREQALKYGIEKIDGVLFTHAHYDHTAGIDDLRIYHFLNKKPLPCIASHETAEELKQRYDYMFKEQPFELNRQTRLILQPLYTDEGSFVFEEIPFSYFSYFQVGMKITGFRFKKLAYVTDIKNYTEDIFDEMKGVEILILSALRFTATPMHFTIDEAVDFAKKVKAKKTWLIHMAHDLEHNKTNLCLPEDIRLSYDGLTIDF